MKLQFLFIVSILLLINISCKKKSDPVPNNPSSGNCHIKQVRSGSMVQNMEYIDGKISRVTTTYVGAKNKIHISELKYYKDSVIEVLKDRYYDYVFKYKIGANGKVEHMSTKSPIYGINGIPTIFNYSTTYYEYDNDGYLVKKEVITWRIREDGSYSDKSTHTTKYTIDNGNIVNKTEFRDGTFTNETLYEYDTDLINRKGNGKLYGTWPEANGKMNKNLLKKEFVGSSVKEYFYDLDQYGNVIKQKVSSNGGPATTAIEVVYDCD
jgi:hypothetical protein